MASPGSRFRGDQNSSSKSDDQTDRGRVLAPKKYKRGGSPIPRAPSPSQLKEKEEEKPMSNFFDFREGSDDIFVESPDTLVKKMRQQAKEVMSHDQPLPEAAPYIPDQNVETIGGAYAGEEERSFSPLRRVGSPESHVSSSPSLASSHSAERPTASPDLSTKEIIARDVKVADLERQIERLKADRWKPPSISDTINRILLGQPCCLEWYKQMDEKRALLDAAIATCDGNCITTILLFIRKTLEFNLLLGMLLKRPMAVQHYCSFLEQLQAWKELSSVYRLVGDYESLGYLKLRQCEEETLPSARIDKLRSCLVMFRSSPALQSEVQYVDEYARLIDKQRSIEDSESRGAAQIHRAEALMFQPLTTTLLYCCRYHRNDPENRPASPEGLRRSFNISEKQFFQVALFALCLQQNWDALDTLLTTKGVFGLGKKKKSPIGFERVVRTLSSKRHKAPDVILAKYLQEVDDLELRLQLATEVGVFDVGIEVLRQLKDHERLDCYINQIPSSRHKEFRGKIQSLLNNTQIKWK